MLPEVRDAVTSGAKPFRDRCRFIARAVVRNDYFGGKRKLAILAHVVQHALQQLRPVVSRNADAELRSGRVASIHETLRLVSSMRFSRDDAWANHWWWIGDQEATIKAIAAMSRGR